MNDPFDFGARAMKFGVLGDPVAHSRSPEIHAAFARQFDITLEYARIQVDPGGFDQAVSHFIAHGGVGLNITLPFKVDAWRMCKQPHHRLSARAGLAAAVNTLVFARDEVFGDNTDGIGLVRDLTDNLGVTLRGARVLLVGAGGGARGVLGPLLECAPAEVCITNRTPAKAARLAAHFARAFGGAQVHACGFAQVARDFDMIINASAASLHGDAPPLPDDSLKEAGAVYDLMYADAPTPFLQWGKAAGAKICADGFGMLVEQAGESFRLWHDKTPDTARVIRELRRYE